jgi:hypothetical protein
LSINGEQAMRIKTKIRHILGTSFYWLYLPLGVCFSIVEIYLNSIGRKGDWVSLDSVTDKKSSDTLFILGSGESINSYTNAQWKRISECDSLGFNFWLLHDFIPTYYMFEFPRNKENLNDFIHNIEMKSDSYQETLMFLKEGPKGKRNTDLLPSEIKGKLKVLFNPTIPIIKVNQIDKAIKFIDKISKRSNSNKKMVVYNKRASLFSAVIFAYLSGYKNIVLCGIDLNNTKYFYESNKIEMSNKGFRVPDHGQIGNIHKTNNNEYGEVTISNLIKKLNDIILKPNNVNLFIGSNQSALSEWLSCYWDVCKWEMQKK